MNIFSPSTSKNTASSGHIRRLNNISGRASEKDKRCGGCAKTTCNSKELPRIPGRIGAVDSETGGDFERESRPRR